MDFLNKIGLARFWEKIKGRIILSETIRKIVVVDELPETEEENVLYLVKQPEITEPENLWKNPTVIEGWFNDDGSYAVIEEGDRIFVSVYNSNSARTIALDSFVNPTLSVEVLE